MHIVDAVRWCSLKLKTGEKKLINAEPTAVSVTLRRAVPTWAVGACPLPPQRQPFRSSRLEWKEEWGSHAARGGVRSSGMRALLLLSVLAGSVCFAQPVAGQWTGYVNGWVRDTPRFSNPIPFDGSPRLPRLTPQQAQYLALQQVASQQFFYAQQNAVQLQQASVRQQELAAAQFAAQQDLAAQQRQAAREAQLAAEAQLLAQQQALAVQQQILAQQQQQAAAEELARIAAREEKVKAAEAEQKLEAEREAARLALARAEADARPREKGPDIHRWVDEDGVVHYSTRPKN